MAILKESFSSSQIRALLKKDFIVRKRQSWMTIIQFIWPCFVFLLLYTVRFKFTAKEISDCQFPTRQLPTKNEILPFFHSYICSIENKCMSTKDYEEYSNYEKAPLRPIIDVAQILINEDDLYNSIVDLPQKLNFVSATLSVVTSPHFEVIRANIGKVVAMIPAIEKMIGGSFDIKKLFSDRKTFVKGGKIICGHPFPNTEYIRLVEDILATEDFSKINDDELDAMPTPYCKKLYLDVTSHNNGKITWSVIKPIIHGKILYGPDSDATAEIVKHSNSTFKELNRLQNLAFSLNTLLVNLKTDNRTITEFNKLIQLAKSPLVKSFIGDAINVDEIETVLNGIRYDKTVAEVFETVKNILECFSVDRFIPVESEAKLLQSAYDLNQKRLFYAGVYFNDTEGKDVVYKFHMDTDNTPVTFENRNRFWFPGPEGNMEEDLKYHRGFVQVKHAIDSGIIRYKREKEGIEEEHIPHVTTESALKSVEVNSSNPDDDWFTEWNDEDNEETTTPTISEPKNDSVSNWDEDSTEDQSTEKTNVRAKRSPQFSDLFSMIFNNANNKKKDFKVDKMKVFTKQFPYPKYTKDLFKKGLYLAQAIQMAFFIGLMAQVATCVRHRIWMKESRNTMLMRSMGLKASSEITAWVITTFIELILIFIASYLILSIGGILEYTSVFFAMVFLVVFGICLISFCYMCSTFFSSATTGSVSTALLFLMSFLPYIIIIYYDAKLTGFLKFATNLSFSSAFCYAWDYIMRMELQGFQLSFGQIFTEGFSNEFLYAFCMIIFDAVIYATIGYILERVKNDEFQFHEVDRSKLDPNTGAVLSNVSKTYDNNKVAVANISMILPKHHVSCLLGRNGAGKSTIIKMLTGQVVPSTGHITIGQTDLNFHTPEKIGLCSQDNILIPTMTAKEHLEMYAKIKIKNNYQQEVDKTLKSLNFGKYELFEASNLSGGYQRRLCVAIAFIGSPNVVILDEPCNGIDSKARKYVWDLVKILRKDRAVVLATHYLDEAEYLSDSIFIMNNGKVIAQHNSQTMKQLFLQEFKIEVTTKDHETIELVRKQSEAMLEDCLCKSVPGSSTLVMTLPQSNVTTKCPKFVEFLEALRDEGKIDDISITSRNLEDLFRDLNKESEKNSIQSELSEAELKKQAFYDSLVDGPLPQSTIIKHLLWKRFVHFTRNYRLLLCLLILPAIFELLAMIVMQLRLGGEFDTVLNLNRSLYPNSAQFFSIETPTNYTTDIYNSLFQQCIPSKGECLEFDNSEKSFRWILSTSEQYQMKRYGGYSFNQSSSTVWYNNKGYHSMMAWLNDLNSNMLQVEMNDPEYKITTFNQPFRLGIKELSTGSLLQQVGDAGAALVILIAFSLVISGSAVYIVNERISGEKLQQKLCGVGFRTYWGVAIGWDFFVYLIALALCVVILKIFNIPVYVDRSNLGGICLVIFLCGFAAIPGVHVFEKLFSESSIAIMTIFCMNMFIAMVTLSIIVLFDVLGESETAASWRHFLNRAFLIFPQHAMADGLIEICKNYIVAEMFKRFDIDAYKSPVTSDLLLPHYISFIVLGVVFLTINYCIESNLYQCVSRKFLNRHKPIVELKIVSIQNSLKRDDKESYKEKYTVQVDGLYRAYKGTDYAVKGVSFEVKNGECYGLLGKNGAGKSTIFKMLSGQLMPTFGSITYFNKEVSYCPQTSAVDPLLTAEEVLKFYGNLRRVKNISQLTDSTLKAFHLENYRKILVKNLSGGNRRKLNVAVACIGQSSVVLMDEPTSDMDPVTRSLVYAAIKRLVAEQRSVVLTSHTISEIEPICQRIAVLKEGRLIKEGRPDYLKTQFGEFYYITLFCNGNDETKIRQIERDILNTFRINSNDIQIHSHTIKFLIKIHRKSLELNGNHFSQESSNNHNSSAEIKLAELFKKLNDFSNTHSLEFTINRCRLDTIFEKILDSSDNSGGYIHEGYVETETTAT